MNFDRGIFIQNSGVQNHIRYLIAKNKMTELFDRWLNNVETEELVAGLIKKVKEMKKEDFIASVPSPLVVPIKSSMGGLSKTTAPQNLTKGAPQTPPRKPFDLSKSMVITSSPAQAKERKNSDFKENETHTLVKTESVINPTLKHEIVPNFFFPNRILNDADLAKNDLNLIKEHFMMGRRELDSDGIKPLTEKLLGIYAYFAPLIVEKYGKNKTIGKDQFIPAWKNHLATEMPIKRSFI